MSLVRSVEQLAVILIVSQERSTLTVFGNNSTTLNRVSTDEARNADSKRGNKQEGHDSEGEGPLQRDDLDKELVNTNSCELCQYTQSKYS